jgi:hypothetical protein
LQLVRIARRGQRDRQLRQLSGPSDHLSHAHPVRADRIDATVDDHLRGVNGPQIQRAGIAALAPGEIGMGEGVLPADIVPVVDVEGERDHVLAPRQLAEEGVGGRAGAAALRGEKLHHHRGARLAGRDGGAGEIGSEHGQRGRGGRNAQRGHCPINDPRKARARITLR